MLDVDVTKACKTIVDPAAPMALRLQGNLLYEGLLRCEGQADANAGTVSPACTYSNAITHSPMHSLLTTPCCLCCAQLRAMHSSQMLARLGEYQESQREQH